MIDFFLSLVLYSHNHNDINHNCNTIHTHIQLKTGGLCCSCTNAFINILTSVFRHEVRDTILIMLIILSDPHQPAAHLTMFKISVGRDPKKTNYIFNGQNPTLNWLFFKLLKFTGPSLPGMTLSTLQPHFLPGGLLWQWWLSYPLRTSVNCPDWLYNWILNPNCSKPNQTEW